MGGLSRRRFLQATATAAAAASLPPQLLASAIASAHVPADVPTTLQRTVAYGSSTSRYRPLVWGPGEPHLLREDFGVPAGPDRVGARRSLLHFAHLSDAHILDSQSPARSEPFETLAFLISPSAARPQEQMTVQVFDQMIRAANAVTHSPVTGAPLGFTVLTGDNTDSGTYAETRWFVDTLDGRTVTPNTGGPAYEGVQVWPEAQWAWHPDDPSRDVYGSQHGFPAFPGLLEAAIGPVETAGSSVPWLTVHGNHDVIWQGTIQTLWLMHMLAESSQKPTDPGLMLSMLLFAGIDNPMARQWIADAWNRPGSGKRTVTPDADARRMIGATEFMDEMFVTEQAPGPVGHGFTQSNLDSGETWWARDAGPFRVLGVDSTNHHSGAEGSVIEPQFRWMEQQLIAASRRYYDEGGSLVENTSAIDRLVVVFSHHNSWTMDNFVFDPSNPYRRYGGYEVLRLLQRFPNAVLWANGHSHENRIVGHASPFEAGAGLWEVNTASCIDFGQQSRTLEIVDNRDGTISIFATVLDHAAEVSTAGTGYSAGRMASISRELSANDPFLGTLSSPQYKPEDALGQIEDRNCELLVKAPFSLSAIADGTLELQAIGARARLLARQPAPA